MSNATSPAFEKPNKKCHPEIHVGAVLGRLVATLVAQWDSRNVPFRGSNSGVQIDHQERNGEMGQVRKHLTWDGPAPNNLSYHRWNPRLIPDPEPDPDLTRVFKVT